MSHAFHSPLMEPMLTEFRWVAETLTYSAPRIPLVSMLTGELAAAGELCTPEFWVRHVRDAVRFSDAIRRLETAGVRTFLELGPDGVLAGWRRKCDRRMTGTVLAPLLAPGPGRDSEQLVTAIARLYVRGTRVDWEAFWSGSGPGGWTCRLMRSSGSGTGWRPAPGRRARRGSGGRGRSSAAGRGGGAARVRRRAADRAAVAGHAPVAGRSCGGRAGAGARDRVRRMAVRAGDEAGCPASRSW